MQTGPQQGPISQSDFLLWREVDRLDARINDLGGRLEYLDQHGTRGIEAMRTELTELRADFQAHDRLHERAATRLGWNIRLVIGSVIALVVPLYPLLLVGHK